ncbi:hypothetical protein TNCV_4099781 [Trichonephila clavipes]|nr:hypothetical protein TNCV_4099781 [Trichonephila clavipes]
MTTQYTYRATVRYVKWISNHLHGRDELVDPHVDMIATSLGSKGVQHIEATRGLLATNLVNLNLSRRTRTTLQLHPNLNIPHHVNKRTLSFDRFKTCINLYALGLQWHQNPNPHDLTTS